MLARYLNAPLLLLLWQVAPVDLKRDDHGRVRVSFGAGRGSFSFRDDPGYAPGVDCAGKAFPGAEPSTQVEPYSTAAMSAEGWVDKTLRLRAAVGNVNDATGELQGTFGAAQAVLERKDFGIGLGLATFGGTEGAVGPSASIRAGSLERFSLRADYRAPEAGMALIGGPRLGIGLNQSDNRRAKLFAGIATTPVPDSARRVGGFVQLALPLPFFHNKTGVAFSAFLGGVRKGTEDKQIYSFAFAGWVQP